MADTALPPVLTQYLKSLAEAHKEALGLKGIFYGDQTSLPEVPALCIEPGLVERELSGTAMKTKNTFNVTFIMYGASIDGGEAAQAVTDEVFDNWVRIVNSDGRAEHSGGTRFGDLVRYGFVERSEYGYMMKDNKLMRANRGLIYALSHTNLLEV